MESIKKTLTASFFDGTYHLYKRPVSFTGRLVYPILSKYQLTILGRNQNGAVWGV